MDDHWIPTDILQSQGPQPTARPLQPCNLNGYAVRAQLYQSNHHNHIRLPKPDQPKSSHWKEAISPPFQSFMTKKGKLPSFQVGSMAYHGLLYEVSERRFIVQIWTDIMRNTILSNPWTKRKGAPSSPGMVISRMIPNAQAAPFLSHSATSE